MRRTEWEAEREEPVKVGSNQMLVGIGRHCTECGRLDFLPYKCGECGCHFCSEHRDSHSPCGNQIDKNNVVGLPCPICGKSVRVKEGSDPDEELARHLQSLCIPEPPPQQRPSEPNTAQATAERRKLHTGGLAEPFCKCSAYRCRAKDLVCCRCPSCGKTFCLKHRHERDHTCTAVAKRS
ncbi:hypothetical protein Pelo_13579 [Pelomyxa schiedti]|nr:hypothetical protein Pelo_13579 [Pelomyxa schiedti]